MPNGNKGFLFSQCESPACESLEQRHCRFLENFEKSLGEYSFLKDEIIKILVGFSRIGGFTRFRILNELRHAISYKLKKEGKKAKRKILKIRNSLFNLLIMNGYIIEAPLFPTNYMPTRERYRISLESVKFFLFS